MVEEIVNASEVISKNAKSIDDLSNDANLTNDEVDKTSLIVRKAQEGSEKSLIESIELAENVEEILSKISNIHKSSNQSIKVVDDIKEVSAQVENTAKDLNDKLNSFKTS
jgi:methyl-accepting chemotaxis protein